MSNNSKRKYQRAVKIQKKRTKRTVKSKLKSKKAAYTESRRMTRSNFLKKYKKALEEHKNHVEGNCNHTHNEEENRIVNS